MKTATIGASTVSEKLPARVTEQAHVNSVVPERRLPFPRMSVPRRIAVHGMQGVDAKVVVTVVHGTVWLSISPPFTWEAVMEPGKVDEVIHVLKLARDEAAKIAAASNGNTAHAGHIVSAVTRNVTDR